MLQWPGSLSLPLFGGEITKRNEAIWSRLPARRNRERMAMLSPGSVCFHLFTSHRPFPLAAAVELLMRGYQEGDLQKKLWRWLVRPLDGVSHTAQQLHTSFQRSTTDYSKQHGLKSEAERLPAAAPQDTYPQLSEVFIKLHLPPPPYNIFLSSEIQWGEQNFAHQIEPYLADKYLKVYIYNFKYLIFSLCFIQ